MKESNSLLKRSIAAIVYSRTILNIDFRIVYPFLPAIARGLGVSLQQAGLLVSIQGGAALFAPLFGPLSDHYGRRRMMELGMLLLGLSALLVATTGQFIPALFAFAGFGLSKVFYDPSMQAYIGDLVPYERRGRVIATTELAWALAWLLGVPASGFLIAQTGWTTPWWMIAILAFIALLLIRLFLPPAHRRTTRTNSGPIPSWFALLKRPRVRAGLLTGFMILLALDNLFIVYGAHMENRFGLALGALGLVSVVIGIAELMAEGGAAWWTDRLGKKRSVVFGLLSVGVTALLLPVFSHNMVATVLGFALVILFTEFTVVSFISLMSEMASDARATLLSMNVSVVGAGRMLGALVGTSLYSLTGELFYNSGLSSGLCLLASIVVWYGVDYD